MPANIANLPVNNGFYANLVGKFIVDTPPPLKQNILQRPWVVGQRCLSGENRHLEVGFSLEVMLYRNTGKEAKENCSIMLIRLLTGTAQHGKANTEKTTKFETINCS